MLHRHPDRSPLWLPILLTVVTNIGHRTITTACRPRAHSTVRQHRWPWLFYLVASEHIFVTSFPRFNQTTRTTPSRHLTSIRNIFHCLYSHLLSGRGMQISCIMFKSSQSLRIIRWEHKLLSLILKFIRLSTRPCYLVLFWFFILPCRLLIFLTAWPSDSGFLRWWRHAIFHHTLFFSFHCVQRFVLLFLHLVNYLY